LLLHTFEATVTFFVDAFGPSGMMRDYLSPERNRVALLTIDAQRDFCMASNRVKPGCSVPGGPAMIRLCEGFRNKSRPIVHVVRLYRCDGSNVELCNRASIEEGQRIVMPGTSGAELVDGLKPDPTLRLDSSLLLDGKFQALGRHEWIMYKPRWSAFYQTPLEEHLKGLGITTLVIAGCNFPNGPLASVYAASNRDFRIVLATDALSCCNDVTLAELARMGVYLMTSEQCLAWLARDGQVAAA
jgi:nicotinamidase-related amidase